MMTRRGAGGTRAEMVERFGEEAVFTALLKPNKLQPGDLARALLSAGAIEPAGERVTLDKGEEDGSHLFGYRVTRIGKEWLRQMGHKP